MINMLEFNTAKNQLFAAKAIWHKPDMNLF